MLSSYPVWIFALGIVSVVAWLIQLTLQLTVWMRMMRHSRRQAQRPAAASSNRPGVSVLVYSNNDAESLAKNLPVLLSQDYPDYEVIVLDDCSVDETQEVMSMMEQRSERLVHTHIDSRARAMSHRKLAVLLGAKAAHHDVLLMTHAACCPSSADWISRMVEHLANPAVEVVLGPVVYERRMSFLSRFCQFDLFNRLLLLMGITLTVRPFAGWGQNLAFRKSTFYANRSQGFQRHLKMQPGEDDLFVADVAREDNVAVECRAESVMTDQSKPLFAEWSVDRLNRGFTSRLYAWAPAVVRGVDSVTRYLTVLPAWAVIGYTLSNIIGVEGEHAADWTILSVLMVMLLARMGLMAYTHLASARALGQRPQMLWPVLTDLYMPLVDVWFRCKALIRRKEFGVGRIGLL